MHAVIGCLYYAAVQLLMMRFGYLDLLGAIGSGLSYRDLIADTVRFGKTRQAVIFAYPTRRQAPTKKKSSVC